MPITYPFEDLAHLTPTDQVHYLLAN